MKKRYTILSFLIPFVFLILIFISNGILFGNRSIFYGDSQYQYSQLLIYLKNVFEGISSFKYSFQVGFGSPMIATLAYYLATPFNILLYFFNNIEVFFVFQVLIKISLSGLTMYKYLIYQNKNNHALIFSTSYALSSYMVCNYFQMMWLDAYLLAPVLLLGIDKLINEKKYILYSIILFLIILSNYYMGYMCALFAVLYFGYKYLLKENKDKKTIKIFLIVSVLSGLMTMFLHIPNLLELVSIERDSFRNYLFNTDIMGILSKLYLGSNDGNMLNEFHPYLYIGIFNIILLVFYFVNKTISKKEKILASSFIIILFASIIFVPLNNFWHALSNPIGFNFRYVFLFNILIISWCFKSFLNIKEIDKKWYYLTFLLFVILSIFVLIRGLFNGIYLYISIIFFLIYLVMLRVNDKDIKIILNFLVMAELFFNGYAILKSYNLSDDSYINGVYKEKTSSIAMIEDEYFYRMEFNKKYGFNDPLNYGYYGVTGWLSSSYINEEFYNKIGYFSSSNMGFYNDSLVLDSLFGIKYYESLDKNKYYDLIANNRVSVLDSWLYGTSYTDSYIYQNPYALSLGYMVNETVKDDYTCENGFDCQNVMFNNMIGYENNVYKIEKIEDGQIEIKSNLDFYILIKDAPGDVDKYTICIDNNCKNIVFPTNRVMFFENNYEIGDKIDIIIDNDNTIDSIYIGYIEFDNFVENYNVLKNNQLNIKQFDEDHIKGNIYVEDNNTLFLSMQYNKNFKILVDGEETKYYKLFDNFIGLDLESGFHEIEIIYEIKGLKLGIIISLISFVLFILYVINEKKKSKIEDIEN